MADGFLREAWRQQGLDCYEEHREIVDELVIAKGKLEPAMGCMLASFGYHALGLLKENVLRD
jgi:hypothetical protein